METRRKEAGRQIKAARRRAGFTSQEAFAAAIGKHETSVGNAERGSDRVGDGVYNAIEDGLGWPSNSIDAYIAGTGHAPWVLAGDPAHERPNAEPLPSQVPAQKEYSAEQRARWRRMSVDEILERGEEIGAEVAAEFGAEAGIKARIRYLRAALQEKETSLSPEDVPQ